jgi:hypothetical protein
LEVGEKLTLNPGEDHASRIGRAAGLANELAGANIQSDLATETQRRNLDGRPVLLERFDSSEKASRVFQKRQDLEDRSRNPGGVILLLRGDKILTLRGPTPPPQVRGMPGLPHQRPSGPPDSAWVEKIRTAFESSTAP